MLGLDFGEIEVSVLRCYMCVFNVGLGFGIIKERVVFVLEKEEFLGFLSGVLGFLRIFWVLVGDGRGWW